jgi:hypothetical protein
MKKKQEPSLVERALSPTPKFFRTLRTIGLSIAAVAGAILTAPVAIPATITTVAAYLAVLGGALSAVAQVTVEGE